MEILANVPMQYYNNLQTTNHVNVLLICIFTNTRQCYVVAFQ